MCRKLKKYKGFAKCTLSNQESLSEKNSDVWLIRSWDVCGAETFTAPPCNKIIPLATLSTF